MPTHDWLRVDVDLFHDFHQTWIVELSGSLNSRLPDGYSALLERRSWRRLPDMSKPVADFDSQPMTPTSRRNRIGILHALRRIACVVEIVSPGNKEGRAARESFAENVVGFLKAGIHVVVVDLFPTGPSFHDLVWNHFGTGVSERHPIGPMLVASYKAERPNEDETTEAFLEPLAIGAAIPEMPAFLESDFYVNLPLEDTYMRAWSSCPKDMRYLVEHGKLPDE